MLLSRRCRQSKIELLLVLRGKVKVARDSEQEPRANWSKTGAGSGTSQFAPHGSGASL
jgi:hypothetical protein